MNKKARRAFPLFLYRGYLCSSLSAVQENFLVKQVFIGGITLIIIM